MAAQQEDFNNKLTSTFMDIIEWRCCINCLKKLVYCDVAASPQSVFKKPDNRQKELRGRLVEIHKAPG